MTRQIFAVLIALCSILTSSAQNILLKLRYEENYTPTYYEVIDMYRLLDSHYKNAKLTTNGQTDSGKPLHTFIINNEAEFNPERKKEDRYC